MPSSKVYGFGLRCVKVERWLLAVFASYAIFMGKYCLASSFEAVDCMHRFVANYSRVDGYSARVRRIKYVASDTPAEEVLDLKHRKPNELVFQFVNRGISGIRNNGMKVEYRGGAQLKVKLGQPAGLFAALAQVPLEALLGEGLSLTNPKVLEGEIFTLNRAGFGYLAEAMKSRLAKGSDPAASGLSLRSRSCAISYRKHTDEAHRVVLKPSDSVFELEERFATLSYLIFKYNPSSFSRFEDLFAREKVADITVPEWFFDFDLDLNPATDLPSRFAIYIDGKMAEEIFFDDVKEVHL